VVGVLLLNTVEATELIFGFDAFFF